MRKAAPWIVLVVSILWATAPTVRPAPASEGFNLDEFARLPVMMDGRVQPIDSAARQALLRIRQTTAVPLEDGRTLTPTEWLLEALVKPHQADGRPIFPIRDPDLRRDVDPASGEASGVTYYSFNQLTPKLEDIRKRGEKMGALAGQDRRAAERSLLTLLEALVLYQRIKNSLQPNAFLQLQHPGKPVGYDLAARLASHQSSLPAGAAALKAREHGSPFDEGALTAMMEFLQPYETVARVGVFQFVPPVDSAKSREGWQNIGVALRDGIRTGQVRPPVTHLAGMSSAFAQGAPEEFNRQLSEYREWLAASGLQSELRTGASEVFYNRLQPSIRAAAFYLLAVTLCAAFWMTQSTMLYRSALTIGGLALTLHTADVVFRTMLQGRPPLTSAYSVMIFVGWVAVSLGAGVEWVRRNGLGIVTSSLVAVLTLIAARGLMPAGDAMEAVGATLNSNLWLAGHVGAITVGYAATLLAGFLAAGYIVLGVCTRWLSPTAAAALDHRVSRLISLAALFTAAGTMVGGFWADQVWGRFWGWDPKENAALLVLLWAVGYQLVRGNGLAGAPTQMSLAAAGAIVTAISWLGVNMMGVGLHSYGFIAPRPDWLTLFVASQMVITGLGLVPLRYWRSHQPHVETPLEYTQPSPAATPVMAPLGVSCTFGDNRGYAMAALLVGMSVMGIMLSIALPMWRTAMQREREAELIFRGEQYAQAIGLFSRRTGGFPTSLTALRDGRYIRKLYKDPITNGDFTPVYLGQVATATPGLPAQGGRAVPGGAVPGQRAGSTGTPTAARGRAGLTPAPGRFGQPPASVAGQPGGRGQPGALSAGPIIGVVSTSTGEALRLYNGRGRYNEWLFVSVAATTAPQAGPSNFQPSLGDGRVLRVPASRRQQLLPQLPRGGNPQLPPGANPPSFPGRNLQPPSGRNPRGRP